MSRLIEANKLIEDVKRIFLEYGGRYLKPEEFIERINAQPTVGEVLILQGNWIPVSERLPKVETNVFICARRKCCGGGSRYIYTVAMYEDGTVLEIDSTWNWEAVDGEWDEAEECYVIPEGWWESTQYHPDGVLNSPVSDEVIAWMPLLESHKAEW